MTAATALAIATLAAALDTRTGRIPNWLTGPALLVGLWVSPLGAILAAALALCARGVAPGDVKAFAAIGAFLGPFAGPCAVVFSLAVAGLRRRIRAPLGWALPAGVAASMVLIHA